MSTTYYSDILIQLEIKSVVLLLISLTNRLNMYLITFYVFACV